MDVSVAFTGIEHSIPLANCFPLPSGQASPLAALPPLWHMVAATSTHILFGWRSWSIQWLCCPPHCGPPPSACRWCRAGDPRGWAGTVWACVWSGRGCWPVGTWGCPCGPLPPHPCFWRKLMLGLFRIIASDLSRSSNHTPANPVWERLY